MAARERGWVLVVDDDADWRELLADHLEGAGFTVAVASDGFVAWTRFLESEPLVVVTDVQMPLMDGRELLARIRERNFRVPVVLVTATESLVRSPEVARAHGIIVKPTDPDRIIAAVEAAITHRISSSALGRLWAAAAPRRPVGDRRGVRASVGAWLWARRQRAARVSLIICLLAVVVLLARRTRHVRNREQFVASL